MSFLSDAFGSFAKNTGSLLLQRGMERREEESWRRKQEFLAKLEEEKEKRQVKQWVMDEKSGQMIGVNSQGEQIRSRPMTSSEAADVQNARSTQEANLKIQGQTIENNMYEMGDGRKLREKQIATQMEQARMGAAASAASITNMNADNARQERADEEITVGKAREAAAALKDSDPATAARLETLANEYISTKDPALRSVLKGLTGQAEGAYRSMSDSRRASGLGGMGLLPGLMAPPQGGR